MYVVNKEVALDEYLRNLGKGEINKLYKEYKRIFDKRVLETSTKETIIKIGILHIFENSIDTFTDKELEELSNLLKVDEVQEVDSMLIDNNFLFINNNEVVFPPEVIDIFKNVDINDISKKNKLKAIEFYLTINGVLHINKLQELLKATELNITKTTLKAYLKELDIKVSKDYVYVNEYAINVNKNFDMVSLKEENENYAIYTLDEMNAVIKYQEEHDYVNEIYNELKKNIKDKKECFGIASLIFDMIRCGYNFEENITDVLHNINVKGSKEDVKKFNSLIEEVYYNTPSWELNGYFPEKMELNLGDEELRNLLSYLNMYMIMNGAIEIDRLLEILTVNHNFNITKDELIEISKMDENVHIINNYFCAEGVDGNILKGLLDQKENLKKYKIIANLDNFFEEHDIMESKLKKLINKYTDKQEVVDQVISLIHIGGINEYTLNITLHSNKINLPENKETRMLKDLQNCQKNVRIWSLNGFTMDELLHNKR